MGIDLSFYKNIVECVCVRKAEPVDGIIGTWEQIVTVSRKTKTWLRSHVEQGWPWVCVFCKHISVFLVAFREASPSAESGLNFFSMISSSVVGPAVTFKVSANVLNVTTAEAVEAAGKAT